MSIVRIIIMMTTVVMTVMLIYSVQAITEVAVEGRFTVMNSPPELNLSISKNEQIYTIKIDIKDANTIEDIHKIVLDISSLDEHFTAVRENGKWIVNANDIPYKIVRVNQSICLETWIFHIKLKEGTWKISVKVYDSETVVAKNQIINVSLNNNNNTIRSKDMGLIDTLEFLTDYFIKLLQAPLGIMLTFL